MCMSVCVVRTREKERERKKEWRGKKWKKKSKRSSQKKNENATYQWIPVWRIPGQTIPHTFVVGWMFSLLKSNLVLISHHLQAEAEEKVWEVRSRKRRALSSADCWWRKRLEKRTIRWGWKKVILETEKFIVRFNIFIINEYEASSSSFTTIKKGFLSTFKEDHNLFFCVYTKYSPDLYSFDYFSYLSLAMLGHSLAEFLIRSFFLKPSNLLISLAELLSNREHESTPVVKHWWETNMEI